MPIIVEQTQSGMKIRNISQYNNQSLVVFYVYTILLFFRAEYTKRRRSNLRRWLERSQWKYR